MIARLVLTLLISIFVAKATGNAAQPAFETIRIGIPGKLVDFSPFFVGMKMGIYRSEGVEPQFIVMRSGIIFPALLSGELDYTTLYGSTIRSAAPAIEEAGKRPLDYNADNEIALRRFEGGEPHRNVMKRHY